MADDAATHRQLIGDLERQIADDGGGLLKDLAAAQHLLRQEDLLNRLSNMTADLQGYIERRAGEVAAPHIAEAGRLAGEEVAAARRQQERAEDLVAEMRRQLSALERHQREYRERATTAEKAIVRGLAALASPPSPDLDAHEHTIATWKRGYHACAEHVIRALNGDTG